LYNSVVLGLPPSCDHFFGFKLFQVSCHGCAINIHKKEKERFIKEMLAGVSEEERSMLKNVLSQMQNNIENRNSEWNGGLS
jgi:Zn-finger protein